MKNGKQKFYLHKISNLINIQKIITIHYQALTKGYFSAEESHDFWEINYADKEDIYVKINGEKTLVKQGEILFIKPNQPHFVECENSEPNLFIVSFSCHSPAMQFFCDKKFSVPEHYRYLLQTVMTEATNTFDLPDFDPLLTKLKLKENPNLGGEQLIKNTLETFFIYLLRYAQNKPLSKEFFLSKIENSTELQDEIVRILTSKIYDKFRLEDLCEQLHYGTTQLCTFFHNTTGKTIYQTYLKLKMDEAKRLIRKNLSFTNVAYLLCFDSISSFTYAFKKITGLTPTEYKKSIK